MCVFCGQAASFFLLTGDMSAGLIAAEQRLNQPDEPAQGLCAEHGDQIALGLGEPFMTSYWKFADDMEKEWAERTAAWKERKAADEEYKRQQELVAEARYQRELPKQRHQFEHALTKRNRITAAWWLGEHCQRRETALAAAAYEYILTTRPPSDHLQLFELATGLRAAGSFDAAERVYRSLLAEHPTDEDSYLGLIVVLRSLGRAKEADAMSRRYGRILELRDLLEQAAIRAKHYHASERIARTAPSIVDLLELDEDPRRVLWSVSLPIAQEVGFAIRTDRRLLFVQDYEYLNSGPQPGQAPEHLSCELGSTWDQKYFPDTDH